MNSTCPFVQIVIEVKVGFNPPLDGMIYVVYNQDNAYPWQILLYDGQQVSKMFVLIFSKIQNFNIGGRQPCSM